MPHVFTRGVMIRYATHSAQLLIHRYYICFVSWCILGFGSATFHATQTLWGEVFDEVGMVISIAAACLTLYGVHPLTVGRRGAHFYSVFILFITGSSIAYINLQYHPFFAICFMASVTVVILLVSTLPVLADKLYLTNPDDSWKQTNSKLDPPFLRIPLRASLRLSVALALSGYASWHVDQACVHGEWPAPSEDAYELYWWYWSHPLWHVLTAGGMFFLMYAVIQARIETVRSGLKRRPGTGSFLTTTKSVREALLISMGLPIKIRKLS